MAKTYVVGAHGGLEAASFQSFDNRDAAQAKYDEWAADLLRDPGDSVVLLEVDGNHCQRLDECSYND